MSADRMTRIEARLDRIEGLLKVIRLMLVDDPTAAYPDANLGAH